MKLKNKLSKREWIFVGIIALLVIALAVGTLLMPKQKAETETKEKSYYDIKCESYAVQNTNLAKEQIVFIGDSITDFYVLDDYYADLPLAVYNRGISGDTTEGVLKRLDVSVIDLKPSKVVLMIGTNDVNLKRENEDILYTYRQIVNKIRIELPDTELYCMSIIPQGKGLEDYSTVDVDLSTEKILYLNAEIEKITEEKGAVYIDLFSHIADENNYLIGEYSDDALHLNAAGFEVWTALLKPYLQ